MQHWPQTISSIKSATIRGRANGSDIYEDRIRDWQLYQEQLPDVLIMENGDIVDGRHRYLAAKRDNRPLNGQVVVMIEGHWVTTGIVVRVL